MRNCAKLYHFRLKLVVLCSISVDAQWITAKKDWREAKKRYKMHQNQMSDAEPGSFRSSEQPARTLNGNMSGTYEKHMDEMRCVLYIHGGKSFRIGFASIFLGSYLILRRILLWERRSGEVRLFTS